MIEQETDQRLAYSMILIIICETLFFLVVISPYFLIGIPISIAVYAIIYYSLQIKVLKRVTRLNWLLIWFLYPWKYKSLEEDSEEAEEIDQDSYAIVKEPELLQLSYDDLKAILESDELADLSDDIKQYSINVLFGANPDLDLSKSLDENELHFIFNVKKELIDFSAFELEFFLEKKLENHLDKKIANFVKNKLSNSVIKKDNEIRNSFINLDKKQILKLTDEIKQKFHVSTNLSRIQEYFKLDFSTTFFRDEVQFFKQRGIKTFADFLKQDLIELEKVFNNKFLKKRSKIKQITWFDLRNAIRILQDEIVKNVNDLCKRIDDNTKLDLLKLRKTESIKFHHNNYIYLFQLNKPVKIVFPGELNDLVIETSRIAIALPDLLEKSFKYFSYELFFKGFPVICPNVESVQLKYEFMLAPGLPLYKCVDCGYLREMDKTTMESDEKELFASAINAIAYLYNHSEAKRSDISRLIEKARAQIRSLSETVVDLQASDLSQEEPAEELQKKMKEIKLRSNPKNAEIPVFWFFTIIAFILGILLGIFFRDFTSVM